MSILKRLVDESYNAIGEGYYDVNFQIYYNRVRLSHAILDARDIPIIAEIKFASPSLGEIREYEDPVRIAYAMLDYAIGLSILTHRSFKGLLDYLLNIRIITDKPLLMKDIIIDEKQIDAGARCGADCILLIAKVFNDRLVDKSLDCLIDYAHSKGLEVLLEVHDEDEFKDALKSKADMIGINNRDLNTMSIDLGTTERLLKNNDEWRGKIIVAESGINDAKDIRMLYNAGARAFLVGSSIMKSNNIKAKLYELVSAID